jgi:hypothetical protein
MMKDWIPTVLWDGGTDVNGKNVILMVQANRSVVSVFLMSTSPAKPVAAQAAGAAAMSHERADGGRPT